MSGAALVGGVTGGATSSIDERKKKRELDEARKAGLVEPEKDAEGNLINPHIPEFMSQAPWYVQQKGPGLHHQKKAEGAEAAVGNTWDAKRDKYDGYDPEEYMTVVVRRYERQEQQRKEKRAQERQSRLAARRKARLSARQARMARVTKRRQKRADALGVKLEDVAPSDTETDSEEDGLDSQGDSEDDDIRRGREPGARAAAAADANSQRHQRRGKGAASGGEATVTGHSLRSREATAKYLYDLNPESAFYEPGTRSMRENPNPQARPGQAIYRGDAELLEGGVVAELASTQLAVWGAYNSGQDITLHGNPTAAEMLHKQMVERKRTVEERRRAALQDRYGGQEHAYKPKALEAVAAVPIHKPLMRPPPARKPAAMPAPGATLGAPSSAAGASARTASGADAAVSADLARVESQRRAVAASQAAASSGEVLMMPSSRYEEDVMEGAHTSAYGSWYDVSTRRWGYACCRSCTRSRKCLGAAGIAARALAARLKAASEAKAAAAGAPSAPVQEMPRPIASGPSLPAAAAAARASRARQEAMELEAAEPSLMEEVAAAVAAGEHAPRPMSERPAPHTSSSMFGGGTGGDGDGAGAGGYGEEDLSMSGAAPLRMDRVAAALQKQQDAAQSGEAGSTVPRDERQRGFMSGVGAGEEEMTAEQVEAYKLTRQRAQDPMALAAADEEEDDDAASDEEQDVSAALQAVQPVRRSRRSRR